ncbi:MAG: hypothetical protein FIB04_07645 [Gammaproteobacteria bacterium]|nr:hypothetical protein [Gammaproteobacteria bacterium]
MRVINSFPCAVLLLLGAYAAAAPDFPAYSVTDLKAHGVWPIAMNEKGQVVGRACCGRQSVGPLLFAAGEVRDLGLPPGGYTSFTPEGINDAGWVVGYAVIPSPDIAVRRLSAALHDGNDWKVIDTSAFGTVTVGTAVNNAGQVIGTTQDMFSGSFTAWLYGGGAVTSVGPAFISYAGAISENGQVVGTRGFDFEASPWTYRDGRTADLPGPGKAIAVNDAGTVLIWVPPEDYPGIHRPGYHAIIEGGVWSRLSMWVGAMNERSELAGSAGSSAALYRGGTIVDLGTLGGSSSTATSINNRAQVAGSSLDATGRNRAFVYEGGVMVDVASLRGVGAAFQLSDAVPLYAGINDNMYLLVRATTGPDTLDAAYLLTPIAPTVTLTARPAQTSVRQPVVLTWVSENANSCVASGGTTGDGWAGTRPTSGEVSLTSSAAGAVRYAIRCSAGPLASESAVQVTYAAAPPTVRLTVTPSVSRVHKLVTLAWTTEGADGCTATGGLPGDGWAGTLVASGQQSVSETQSGVIQYGVRCVSGALSSEATVSVTYTKKSGGGGALDVLIFVIVSLGLMRGRVARGGYCDRRSAGGIPW